MKTKNYNNFSFKKKKTKKQSPKKIILGGGPLFEINFIPKRINVTLIYNPEKNAYGIDDAKDNVMKVSNKQNDNLTLSNKDKIIYANNKQILGSKFDYTNFFIVPKYNSSIKTYIEFSFMELLKILICINKNYTLNNKIFTQKQIVNPQESSPQESSIMTQLNETQNQQELLQLFINAHAQNFQFGGNFYNNLVNYYIAYLQTQEIIINENDANYYKNSYKKYVKYITYLHQNFISEENIMNNFFYIIKQIQKLQTESSQTESSQTKSSQTESSQTESSQTESSQTESNDKG